MLAAVVLAGCLGILGPEDGAGGPAGGTWTFVDVAEEAGFDSLVGELFLDVPSPPYATLMGGVAVADVNGDGWQDVLVTNGGPNDLYVNQGDGTFEEQAVQRGVPQKTPTEMPLLFDKDNDGDPDLFLANDVRPSLMYRNDDGVFVNETDESGVGRASSAYAASAVDVNGDGYLDLSVGNYGPLDSKGPDSRANATNGARDYVYVNQGDGTFRDMGYHLGIRAELWTFSHAWNDVDGDGDPDLYMNVDFGHDVLYENRGDAYVPVTEEVGTVTNRNGMGARWVDVDGDLDLDLFATNIYHPDHGEVDVFRGNNLFENQGDGTFRDVAEEAGVADGGWGWDSVWQDFDHDGHVDAVQTNGMATRDAPDAYYDATPRLLDEEPEGRSPQYAVSDRYNETKWLVLEWDEDVDTPVSNPSMAARQVDRVFRNQGNGSFERAAADVGLGANWTDGRAVPAVDFDHDGDLDLVRTAYGRQAELLENRMVVGDEAPGDAHWLQVELVGNTSNRDAVGARVIVEAGNLTLLRQRSIGGGFLSQSQGALHFGLGGHEVVDTLQVRWPEPGGRTVSFEDVEADQAIRVTEPDTLETGVWEGP